MKKVIILSCVIATLGVTGCSTHGTSALNHTGNTTASNSTQNTSASANATGNTTGNSTSTSTTTAVSAVAKAYVVQRTFKDKQNTVHYPQFVGLPNASVQAKLNAYLKTKFMPSAKDQANTKHTYTANYSVVYRQGDVMNIMLSSYYMPAGAAHGMPAQESIILNMQTGTQYAMKDLFTPGSDYLKAVSDVVRKQDTQHLLDTFQKFTGVTDKDSFYLTSDGIEVYFQPYQWTPFSDGFPSFKVPYSQLGSVLNTNGDLWSALHAPGTPDEAAMWKSNLQKVQQLGFVVDTLNSTETPTVEGQTLFALNAMPKGNPHGAVRKVFFFLNNRYLGTDTAKAHGYCYDVTPVNQGSIAVTYANYPKQDFTIVYNWIGSKIVPTPSFPSTYKDWH